MEVARFGSEEYRQQQRAWTKAYYGDLKGATCVGVRTRWDDGEYGTGDLMVQLIFEKNGERFPVEVWTDEEGNGAGFLMGLAHPGPMSKMAVSG